MKGKFKKILAFFIAAVVAATALSIPASAKGVFDGAINMEKLEFYSKTFKEDYETVYYKIKIPQNGNIIFKVKSANAAAELLDSNANTVFNFGNLSFLKSDPIEVKKGTYYLSIKAYNSSSKFEDLYYTFTPDHKPTISLSVSIKKGNTIEFGSVVENYSGKVSWLSTKPEIASVSKGTVTAKKKGTTTIRAQLDSGEYVQIKVKVK